MSLQLKCEIVPPKPAADIFIAAPSILPAEVSGKKRVLHSLIAFWSAGFFPRNALMRVHYIPLGCPVAPSTCCQSSLRGSICLRFSVAILMGTWVKC